MGIGKVFLFSMGKGMGHSPVPLIVLGGWMDGWMVRVLLALFLIAEQ